MKYLFSITLCFSFFLQVQAQTPTVYFNFITHNEETGQWNGNLFYTANRSKLISLTNYFYSKGISWNMQSDWVYLSNVLSKETPVLMSQTNNKNILRWMYEDKGVEMDPHAHESVYLYPDVVKLMDSIGLPESKVIGGTIYNDSNGVNIWTNLVNGQYGAVFPTRFWKPDYMMGGGTPNHVADLKYYGFWNPQSPSNYLTHDTSVHLRHLGVGCTIKIQDTTQVTNIVAQLHDLIDKVQSGQYPGNGFYLQTIFFEQAELNDSIFYNKVIAIADSAQAIVNTGAAQWKTFKQAYTIWENAYQAQMFQWDCGAIATAADQVLSKEGIRVYPNPADEILWVKGLKKNDEVQLMDLSGRCIQTTDVIADDIPVSINIQSFTPGLYLLRTGGQTIKCYKR
ncbi:MAG: T9SS type A sorting domain-containing protein [Chitinophagaceae bacterium]|nr:T9SS type A sorting domain-containing protein [Chitinophagaceae bacterium]